MAKQRAHLHSPQTKIFTDLSELKLARINFETMLVFTNGCFDLLHRGHIDTLFASAKLGDQLVVGLNSDASIRRLKGPDRPIQTWMDRAMILASLYYVDIIVGFDEDTPIELIKHLRPQVITKGGDYKIEDMIGADVVNSYGGRIEVLPYRDGHSTTAILQR
ncbi:MAG: D-glycero-beta-D-manno-heptose 1-phosphate adenylyltransferase [Bacteroidota bacterium]